MPAVQQFMISVNHDRTDLAATIPSDPAEIEALVARVGALNDALAAADAMVFGGGLMPPETAKVIEVRDGEVLLTDGPFIEAKEFLGGFWIVKAHDLDGALDWARQAAEALGHPVEVRPLQEEVEG